MVKLVIFDLDGVLVDTKNLHFDALNMSLENEYKISWNEHLSVYDGLKTQQKLDMLTQQKGLPIELHKSIWETKQKITLELLKSIEPNEFITSTMVKLSEDGYKIAVCSNSIRKTVLTVLSKLNIIEYIDFTYNPCFTNNYEIIEKANKNLKLFLSLITEAVDQQITHIKETEQPIEDYFLN
jgi:beta-phosphoglucomutase-like phosphatase (HAD superfamily)